MRRDILIADDHPLFAQALQLILTQLTPGAATILVASISDAEAAITRASRPFDFVLLDLTLPGTQRLSGLMSLRERLPQASIAIVASCADEALVRQAANLGASGFLPKTLPLEELAREIGQLLAGASSFPKAAAADVPPAVDAGVRQRLARLTPAQLRVLTASASGRPNKQIAYDMGISEATVKAHMHATLKKLNVHNRMQAVLALKAMEPGLGAANDRGA